MNVIVTQYITGAKMHLQPARDVVMGNHPAWVGGGAEVKKKISAISSVDGGGGAPLVAGLMIFPVESENARLRHHQQEVPLSLSETDVPQHRRTHLPAESVSAG